LKKEKIKRCEKTRQRQKQRGQKRIRTWNGNAYTTEKKHIETNKISKKNRGMVKRGWSLAKKKALISEEFFIFFRSINFTIGGLCKHSSTLNPFLPVPVFFFWLSFWQKT
jgi:hypothetical protein